MSRYFFSRRKDGLWYVNDRKLKIHVSRSDYREQAILLTIALNNWEASSIPKCSEKPSMVIKFDTGVQNDEPPL